MFDLIKFPELYFGLVAPVGVNLEKTATELSSSLQDRGYTVHILKVTDLYDAISGIGTKLYKSPLLDRYKSYISFGNEFREKSDDPGVLAALTVAWISQHRERYRRDGSAKHKEKEAYILHQFKRKEEIDILRQTYGRLFFQISTYSSRRKRAEYLANRFAEDAGTSDFSQFLSDAEELIQLDEAQTKLEFGQRVREVFHHADFIINRDDESDERTQINRFVDLIFGRNDISPTRLEYGMYMAKGAALRSLDLSRQVGAAIFTKEGEIVTLGCNEVPKGLGGTYWAGDKFDARDFRRGEDPNERIKRNNALELLERLNSKYLKKTSDELREIVDSEIVSESRIMDALEFGRIIHAEMSAITDASRLGRATAGSVLFCTTFPCHMCAKHIISSGISTVYFLEPYPKSHAYDLHSDSLKVEGSFTAEHESYPKTEFIHFSGVSPRRYRDLFERGKRKSGGKFKNWLDSPERPMFSMKLPMWCTLEDFLVMRLRRDFGLSSTLRKLRSKPFSSTSRR